MGDTTSKWLIIGTLIVVFAVSAQWLQGATIVLIMTASLLTPPSRLPEFAHALGEDRAGSMREFLTFVISRWGVAVAVWCILT
jgi:hypothetical protein